MIAGTYVQTDQIKQAFDDIEQTANAGNDVVVTARQAFKSDVATPRRRSTRRRSAPSRAVPGVRRGAGPAL